MLSIELRQKFEVNKTRSLDFKAHYLVGEAGMLINNSNRVDCTKCFSIVTSTMLWEYMGGK